MSRTNQVLNPRGADSGAPGWSTSVAAGYVSSATVVVPPGGGVASARRVTLTAVPASLSWFYLMPHPSATTGPAVTPGARVSAAIRMWASRPGALRIMVGWRDSAGVFISWSGDAFAQCGPDGEGTWMSIVTAPAPAGAAKCYVAVGWAFRPDMVVGDWVQGTQAIVEVGRDTPITPDEWFDGASATVRRGDGYELRHAWTGTANASTSTESDWVPGEFSVTGDGVNPPRVVVSSDTGVPAGAPFQVTGAAGGVSWPVRGGAGVWAGEQVAMLDPMCPVGVPVTYTLRARTSAGAVTTLSAGPVVRVSPSSMTVTSLDGRRMVRVRVLGSDEQGASARIQRFDIPGARRPVLRLDTVSDATEGTLEWASTGSDTAMLSTLMGENMPLICLHDPSVCQIPDCDIPPVRLLMPLSWRHQRAGRIDVAERRWQVPWLEVDDPTPDQRVMPSVWDEFDAINLLWPTLEGLSLTWDQFDLMSWATYTPGA